ncbi:MAG: hypothetical protein PHI55_10025 [Burkholderiaceae bacterium]|nr:hypothetical protein [Burkholderiaceae bacterium]
MQPRLIVQSSTTGRFLVPGPEFPHSPEWVVSLRDAGAGVVSDLDQALGLIEEYAEIDDRCTVIDLDRLGTINDY